MSAVRNYSFFDRIIMQIDSCLQTIYSDLPSTKEFPAQGIPSTLLTKKEQKQSSAFMRINHSGEVCAQALYNAQALIARDPIIKANLIQAGKEETDHLAWCHQRLKELDSHRSYLNFFWYWNSFFIGFLVATAGDKWSLGFIEETEIQVTQHLERHRIKLASYDERSTIIVKKMQQDEAEHALKAKAQGAEPLAPWMKTLMSLHAKVMTTLTYWI